MKKYRPWILEEQDNKTRSHRNITYGRIACVVFDTKHTVVFSGIITNVDIVTGYCYDKFSQKQVFT